MTGATIREQRTFICYQKQERNGKTAKVPMGADGYPIGVNEKFAHRFASFKRAIISSKNKGFDGVGFVFSQLSNGLYMCGIDIDHRAIDDEVCKDVIAMFPNAYIEYSPSGDGLHLVFAVDISKLPIQRDEGGRATLSYEYCSKNNENGLECYISGLTNRYFTYTGKRIQDGKDVEQTAELIAFLNKYMKRVAVVPCVKSSSDYNLKQNTTDCDNSKSFDNTYKAITSFFVEVESKGSAMILSCRFA